MAFTDRSNSKATAAGRPVSVSRPWRRPAARRSSQEKISTRVKHRPEMAAALKLAHDIKETAPDQVVILPCTR
ncbi:hypothetical protein GCM10009753_27870 [Streptantibioticus ferralitis]